MAATDPSQTPAFLNAAKTVYGDLNSGNYTDAWNTALGTSSMFGTNMSATTKDPLLEALETSNGLQAFDPGKKWDASSLNSYYSAFNATGAYHGNNTGSNGYLGKNVYGLWGDASAITSGKDQAANIAQEGLTPDVMRFVGAKPTQSFLSKYGAEIGALALTAATMGAAAPLAGAVFGGTTALDLAGAGALIGATGTAALDGIEGKALTFGSVANGALKGVSASGALNGLGMVDASLAGAALGGAGAALSHGNIEMGLLSGAATGAIKGSGLNGLAATGAKIGTNLALGNIANSQSGGGTTANNVGATAPTAAAAQNPLSWASGMYNGFNTNGGQPQGNYTQAANTQGTNSQRTAATPTWNPGNSGIVGGATVSAQNGFMNYFAKPNGG